MFRDRVGEGEGGFWYESRDFSQSEHRWVWFLGGQSSYLFTQWHWVFPAILWQILKFPTLHLVKFISFYPAALTWTLQPIFQRASGGSVFFIKTKIASLILLNLFLEHNPISSRLTRSLWLVSLGPALRWTYQRRWAFSILRCRIEMLREKINQKSQTHMISSILMHWSGLLNCSKSPPHFVRTSNPLKWNWNPCYCQGARSRPRQCVGAWRSANLGESVWPDTQPGCCGGSYWSRKVNFY